jgi:hypothetical protein
MRIVVALGGNALLRRGEPMTADNQRANIRIATEPMNWSSPTAMVRRSGCCRCKPLPTPRFPLTRWTCSVLKPKA